MRKALNEKAMEKIAQYAGFTGTDVPLDQDIEKVYEPATVAGVDALLEARGVRPSSEQGQAIIAAWDAHFDQWAQEVSEILGEV